LVAIVFGGVVSYVTELDRSELKSILGRAPVSETVVRFSLPYHGEDFAEYDDAVRARARALMGEIPSDVFGLFTSADVVALRPGSSPFTIGSVLVQGPDVSRALTLVSGRRPAGPSEVAIPAELARDHDVAVGSVIGLGKAAMNGDGSVGTAVEASVTVVGVYRSDLRDSALWQGLPDSALSRRGAEPRAVLVVGGAAPAVDTSATAVWVVRPHVAGATSAQLSALMSRVVALPRPFLTPGPTLTRPVTVSLHLALEPALAARAVLVGESGIALPLGVLALLAATAMVRAARITADRRRPALALERARGASPRVLMRGVAIDGLGFAAVGGAVLTVVIAPSLFVAITVVGIMTIQAVLTAVASIPAVTEREPGAARRRRSARTARFQRAGTDIVLMAIAGWGMVALRRAQSPFTGPAGGSLDPVLILVPPVIVAALAFLALRLLPSTARLLDRYASRSRTLTGPFGAWQVSRRTSRLGGGVLLASMAVSVGALAVTAPAMRDRAVDDQAAFQVGAAVRADGPSLAGPAQHAAYAGLPGVSAVTPLWTLDGVIAGREATPNQDPSQDRLTIVGVDPTSAGRVMTQGAGMPTDAQLAALRTAVGGFPLAGRPTRLRLLVKGVGPVGASVRVAVEDADGHILTATQALPGLTGVDQSMEFDLTGGLPGGSRLSYPLRFQGIALSFPVPAASVAARVVVDGMIGISADGVPSGAVLPEDLKSWQLCGLTGLKEPTAGAGFSDPACSPDPNPEIHPIRLRDPGPVDRRTIVLAFDTGEDPDPGRYTVVVATHPVASTVAPVLGYGAPLAAIVTREFLAVTGAGVGDQVAILGTGYGGVPEGIGVHVIGVVDALPGIPVGRAAALTDIAALGDGLFDEHAPGIAGESWLLATRADSVVARALADRPELGVASTRAASAAELRADRFRGGARNLLLACALLAPLFALLGFTLDSLASLRERSVGFAVLRALGVRRRQLQAALWIEQGVVSGLASVAGVAIGVLAAALTEPLLATSPDGSRPFPAMRILVPWLRAIGVGVAAAASITALVLLVARFAGRLDLARVLRAGEDE
jgi:hypothetical protein